MKKMLILIGACLLSSATYGLEIEVRCEPTEPLALRDGVIVGLATSTHGPNLIDLTIGVESNPGEVKNGVVTYRLSGLTLNENGLELSGVDYSSPLGSIEMQGKLN